MVESSVHAFNRSHLLNIVGDDESLEQEILRLFLECVKKCISQLEKNLQTKESNVEWDFAASELKGAAASIMAKALADKCLYAEKVPANDIYLKSHLLHDIKQEAEKVKSEISEYTVL